MVGLFLAALKACAWLQRKTLDHTILTSSASLAGLTRTKQHTPDTPAQLCDIQLLWSKVRPRFKVPASPQSDSSSYTAVKVPPVKVLRLSCHHFHASASLCRMMDVQDLTREGCFHFHLLKGESSSVLTFNLSLTYQWGFVTSQLVGSQLLGQYVT